MVFRLHSPKAALEAIVRISKHSFLATVREVELAEIDPETAFEAAMEGALDAIAERLACVPDGVHKAFEVGDSLAARVQRKMAQRHGPLAS